MGCASSSAIPKLPETYHQLAPVEAKLCASAITTLRLRDRFWDSPNGEDFVICNTEWGHDVFRIQGTTSAMKTLRDPLRNPLVHIKRELLAPTPTYNVYDAKTSASKLFSIKALPELNVEFQCPTLDQKCRIGLTGNWAKRQASIWMEQGRKGSRTTIGRVFRSTASRSSVATTRSSSLSCSQTDDEYFLAIMGGVDMSMMVLICIALEQAHSEDW
ncbi:unnamed protein product [Peronospora belbahrii]|uniref:Tubby C-terminal domain-containing protein n=1 Tax=Peronospora belbahrii TaxID=622444 RepID=A0AAU9L7R2_9STRA|nr:unnamed protein product [Peronospora belbahrii]CAH0522024.1 unnamed protein product [Peronospora belbahrii]